MKRLIATLAMLVILATIAGTATATPKVEPQSLSADLTYWGLNPNAPYPKLIFYEGGVPWLNYVGGVVYYQYVVAGCAQEVRVYVPPATCPTACKKAVAEGVANAHGVYRVIRFDAGDEYWGDQSIPYIYDSSTNILTLTLPSQCNRRD